ncbi:hypothetical protein INT43_008831 [Umbelopsis isabellina]|uniref:Ribonuclease H n=1 Tax=Mortierella isabellina TaxID=91625 RepID=A0A8H7PVZ1_MORIS|nr:hypothetical protein INT43_008831 [Umbelopsis isabellina]
MPKAARGYYYAVRTGRKPGIYKQWSECELQVKGFPYARYKKFATEAEANAFMSIGTKGPETDAGFDAPAGKVNHTSTGSYIVDTFPASTVGSSHNSNQTLRDNEFRKLQSRHKEKAVKKREQTPEEGTSVVYTDGASAGNGTAKAFAGVGVYFGPNDPRNVSEPLEGKPTNQRAEIMAVIRAIERCDDDHSVTTWRKKWIEHGWTTSTGAEVKNKDLFERLFDLIDKRPGVVEITHVQGHSGHAGNEMADRFAVQGAQMAARLKLEH